jgi:photosystem II stability/assembly factor-like uncharacterized protein
LLSYHAQQWSLPKGIVVQSQKMAKFSTMFAISSRLVSSKHFIVVMFLWLGFVSAARAQIRASVVVPESVGDTAMMVSSLSCSGNVFIVSLLSNEDRSHSYHLLFRRSIDGGLHWGIQDPGLPDQQAVNRNRITKVVQVDSLTTLAIGDTAFVLRSSDAGKTWKYQRFSNDTVLDDISARDDEAIILSRGKVYTSVDRGEHWRLANYLIPNGSKCLAEGNGRFTVFEHATARLFSTSNDWKDVDSTAPAFPLKSTDSTYRVLVDFRVLGNTIIAYGNDLVGVPARVYPLIARSTDRGHSWKIALEDTTLVAGAVNSLSSLAKNNVYAGTALGRSRIFVSHDNGLTWHRDTIYFDTAFKPMGFRGLDVNPTGFLVAAMGLYSFGIVVGKEDEAAVETYRNIPYYSYLFPNPANESVRVISEDRNSKVEVFDLLGRAVASGRLSNSGTCSLDVTDLPASIYVVMVDHAGMLLPVGRVAIRH